MRQNTQHRYLSQRLDQINGRQFGNFLFGTSFNAIKHNTSKLKTSVSGESNIRHSLPDRPQPHRYYQNPPQPPIPGNIGHSQFPRYRRSTSSQSFHEYKILALTEALQRRPDLFQLDMSPLPFGGNRRC